ncbi:hypothetical protein J6590_091484 [Homalodisca vitripennis]|nr:hypothetical protein J6590_091484 [Homalodisca vitripennis]
MKYSTRSLRVEEYTPPWRIQTHSESLLCDKRRTRAFISEFTYSNLFTTEAQ